MFCAASFRIPAIAVSAMALVLSACATPAANRRAAEWRQILASEAPIGASAARVTAALQRRGIDPAPGTYTTVHDSGARSSPCPDPAAAITGSEVAGRVGFNSNVLVITTCLDRQGRVASHDVGVWIQ